MIVKLAFDASNRWNHVTRLVAATYDGGNPFRHDDFL
jgi:hypothetical protein